MPVEKITLHTSDQIEISGLVRGLGQKKAAILLHMMPATKESWDVFATELEKNGYASVAIDERGHGESTMGGTLDYHQFDEKQQQAKIYDVEAAFVYLKQNGFVDEQIVVVGASIGANLAIQFLVSHPNISTVIALSPGLNYRGVKTDEFITHLHTGQHVVLVASDDDDRESAASSRTLHEMNPAQTILIEKQGLGHGTTMLQKDPSLLTDLLSHLP